MGHGRGMRRFNSFLGVVNAKPRFHSFIGISKPQQAHGDGGADAPKIPTPFVFHNDEESQKQRVRREEGIDTYSAIRRF